MDSSHLSNFSHLSKGEWFSNWNRSLQIWVDGNFRPIYLWIPHFPAFSLKKSFPWPLSDFCHVILTLFSSLMTLAKETLCNLNTAHLIFSRAHLSGYLQYLYLPPIIESTKTSPSWTAKYYLYENNLDFYCSLNVCSHVFYLSLSFFCMSLKNLF